MNNEYDFIVIGAGSAGCVMACRLVQAGKSVLLLEAGPDDKHKFIQMPATFVRVIGTDRTWVYETTAQSSAAGRTMYIPQGRTLGGSSSVNAMVYIRGNPSNYDHWAQQGCAGWAWNDVLPYFRKAESNQRLAGELHGTDGLLPVSDTRFRHPLSLAFVQSAQECGYAYNHDFNGSSQIGAGFYQTTTLNGERASTSASYLAAVSGNPGLTIQTHSHVEHLVLNGKRVCGVSYRTADGAVHQANAKAEVIVSAGALASPKVLQLSGIGAGKHLQSLGIAVACDLPGVGENFQDHLEVSVYGHCREPISLLGNDKGLKAIGHALQWSLLRTGLLTSNVVESGGFFDTTGSGLPDVQFHVLPVLVGDVNRPPLEGHGISLNPCCLQPASRGTVRLKSASSTDAPLIDAQFLSDPSDVDTLKRGVQLARKFLRAPSMAKLIDTELEPSGNAEISDQALESYVRSRAKTVYHPAGTCRMGTDSMAVVDTELRVHGVEGVRICDASVMPTLPSGNTNAPVIMIAERCADFVLAAHP